ncbi:hypothetical protein [Tortoise microvirus 49]|nr:hypothetical protein [Tortoise microvirus 49]
MYDVYLSHTRSVPSTARYIYYVRFDDITFYSFYSEKSLQGLELMDRALELCCQNFFAHISIDFGYLDVQEGEKTIDLDTAMDLLADSSLRYSDLCKDKYSLLVFLQYFAYIYNYARSYDNCHTRQYYFRCVSFRSWYDGFYDKLDKLEKQK